MVEKQLSLSWVVDRFENGQAVLIRANEPDLVIPRSSLPKNVKEGDAVSADFFLLKHEKKRRENIARALLEEILGS